jgi:hypothetical protein
MIRPKILLLNLLWALELVTKENFARIVVEGDAKGFFDALNDDPCNVN